MVFCGISIAGFTFSVFLDVVTRKLGRRLLWLQLVTTGFFAWGVFIGMAVGHAPDRPSQPGRDHQAHERAQAHVSGNV